jgi:RNA polymerase sigma factor (sigma-70 family)
MEDTNWLERLRRREHDAFAELVQKHQRQVFLCCSIFGLDGHEAEDVASETFLAAWKSIPSFNGKAKLSTWLWSIAYHKAMDSLRQKQPIIENLNPDDQIAAKSNRSHAVETDRREIIWSAVKQLPQPWPLVVILFYREDKSIAEIAAIMDIPENTVKIYLYRARQKLKESLNGLWRDESQCI